MCVTNSAMRDGLLEIFREGLLIEEDVGVLKFPVEPVFDLLHAVHDIRTVAIAYKHDKGGVGFSFGELDGV